ncbi:MAG: RluA family pseudouridine synthase [Oscillospiraceae bacterium]|nr:RluA family pseudouridine synthase [Oscillospiraceae bacterium]
MTFDYIVAKKDDGRQLGEFLSDCGLSHRLITSLKRTVNGMTVNGERAKTIAVLHEGDKVCINLPEDKTEIEPNGELCAPIVFEDEHIVVFDKPASMPCHPSIKHRLDTLANYFSFLYPDKTFRCINRLDRDTSGLCICAKDSFAATALSKCVEKTYFAAVCGVVLSGGTIDAPIAREQESIIIRCVREDGQRAVTHYKPIRHSNRHTLLEINLETGRTHQIRVHMAHIGHPLAGDGLYGGDASLERQGLHCGRLEFVHPITKEKVELFAPLPKDIEGLFG